MIAGSLQRHIIGRAVFTCFFDEISFQPTQDIEKQKEKAKTLISTATARMQSRFMKGEKDPTLLFMASSKRTEQSFLETFIESKKKNESKTTLVVDEPQWVIRTDKDSPNKFKVAVGNKFLNSEVVPLNATEEDINNYINRGYKLINVPMGYYEQFIDDIDIALTDCAGISTTNVSKYINGARLQAIKKQELKNPFKSDIIEVGNGDNVQYYEYFDMSKVDPKLKSRPMFIHLDMSVSGDKTGIAGIYIKGKKPHQPGTPETNELFYSLAFAVSIKAPKGYQISFEKNRNFIFWLKEQGFNIKGVSSDTFQSVDTGQQLAARGFKYEVVSVDKVDTDRICKPYQYFKNTIYEERLEIFDSKLLTEEVLGLERNNNTGKIDHPDGGRSGCFTGDTKVSLVDGRELSLLELVQEFNEGKRNYVYSFNEKKKIIEPKLIEKAWCTIQDTKVIQVELDSGSIIKCTPNHKFMLRDGSYKEAKNLCENDSLMPLYRKYPSKGLSNYRMYYEPIEDK
ncbi:Hint domain-containing protein [uncultured Clostridium sp.]|uniref:Hint domain-containing protein n=1 Tax=uncultured Clostridium sp. TaxID=59620 RepID=UPI00262332E8|nr:Hint domain-containing protein [uncultured Clostridium sp.]